MSESEKVPEPELSFEVSGHIRYLVVKENGVVEKIRIPLHVWNMKDETAQHWYYQDLVKKLKRKMKRHVVQRVIKLGDKK